MMLKTVFLFNIFYLSFGTNYFNDDDWILELNQGWPLNTCQFNGIESAFDLPSNYIEYGCNGDGSVTKYIYGGITAEGECDMLESTVNYTSFSDPAAVGAYECDSFNKYAEVIFTGYFLSDGTPGAQCVPNPQNTFQGRGVYKWTVDTCSSNGNNSIMFTCSTNPGMITATRYNNSMCNSSDITEVININEGECALYIQTKAELPESVPNFGGLVVDVFAYASFGSCVLSEPTMAPSLAPTMEPTQITAEPTLMPSELPTTATLAPVTSPENDSKANTSVIYTFSIIFTIAIAFMFS